MPASFSSATITFKNSFLDFDSDEKEYYAIIGCFVSKVAKLEVEIDSFIFFIAEKFPKLAWNISKRIPVKANDKIDFIINCFIMIPKLREVGDLDNRLDLNGISYGLEELWSARNHIVHSGIEVVELSEDRIVFTASRYVRLKKLEVEFVTYKYSSVYLKVMLKNIHYYKSNIRIARKIMTHGADKLIKDRDSIIRGQAQIREFRSYVALNEDGGYGHSN